MLPYAMWNLLVVAYSERQWISRKISQLHSLKNVLIQQTHVTDCKDET